MVGVRLTSMVLDQWHLHPALGGEMIVSVVIHTLSADGQVLPARQVILVLIIAHPNLIPTLEEIVIWLVYEYIHELKLSIKLHLQSILLKYRVVEI